MPDEKKKMPNIENLLLDPSVPIEERREFMRYLCAEAGKKAGKIIESVLEKAASSNGKSMHAEKVKELAQLLEEIKNGVLRCGIFLEMVRLNGSLPRGRVVLEDGGSVLALVPDSNLATSLCCGDAVTVDGKGCVLVGRAGSPPTIGEVGRLERQIDDRVEVSVRDERFVFRASKELIEKLEDGQAAPGSNLLVCGRRHMAFDALPEQDGRSHYEYVDRKIPNVDVNRDIGSPPRFIEELVDHVWMEMKGPQSARRYRLRRSIMKLLIGRTGTGKTLSIEGVIRAVYELISKQTGVPLEDIPPRVMRLRMAKILSKWLGESDKRLDRFFDEVEELADERLVAPDGTSHELPLIVICEEIDGLARRRGTDHEAVFDRIMTTALQRLDTTRPGLSGKLVIFLFTSNVPRLIDTAFLRRAGGTIERFGGLNKRAFTAVLEKHLRDRPISTDNGRGQQKAAKQLVRDVTAWLYSPNADQGLVELTFVNAANSTIKHRRDFLTGALVDRAVEQASMRACKEERLGADHPGLTSEMVITALDAQLGMLCEHLDAANCHEYIDLPDTVRVATVRRIEQPSILPFQLHRSA